MIRLSLDLRASDGRQILSVLAQPKRVALLAYLAANRDFVRRDTLLGLFWPESDEEHARHALRQSLYTLRRSLGPRALSSRGDEELGIDCDHLECDVAAFEVAVRDGQAEAALELYRGDLLEGFFLSDAAEFEKWLDGRRTTLRTQAAEAAWTMAQRAEDDGDRTEAAAWGRKATVFSQDDESTVQRLVALLDRVGDRAAALRAYEAFAWRLENELGLQPSPETQALISQIRARQDAGPRSGEVRVSRAPAEQTDGEWSVPDESLLEGAPTVTSELERAAAEVSGETAAARPGDTTAETDGSPQAIGATEAKTPDGEPKKHRVRLGIAVAALAAAAVIVDFAEIVQWTASRFFGDDSRSAVETPMEVSMADLDPKRIAVLYFDDHSENQDLEYLANGLTEELISRLSAVPELDIVSRNGVKPYRKVDVALDSIVRVLQPGTIVEGSVMRSGNLIRAHVQLIDAGTNAHVGSRTLERLDSEVFALLDDISNEVALFLRERLGEEIGVRELRAGTQNHQAWRRFQQAEVSVNDAEWLGAGGDAVAAEERYARADSLLSVAESLDPDWLAPILARGWVAFERAWLGKARPTGPALRVGLEHAERALEIQPAEQAYELRGTCLAYLGWDEADPDTAAVLWNAAEADLRTALAGDPSLARAWAQLSHVYIRLGRFEEASLAARRGLEADAFLKERKSIWYWNGRAALDSQNFEEALRWTAEGLEMDPEYPGFVALRLLTYATGGGDPPPVEESWALVAVLQRKLGTANPSDPPRRWMMMAAVLARAGLPDSARQVVQRARSLGSEGKYLDYFEAVARLALGDRDTAISRLGDYLNADPSAKRNVASDWLWQPLSDSPEFQELVAETD
jgi:serine/threonine-protein kinase